MINNNLFVDIACAQRNCFDESICGDTYITKHSDGRGYTLAVLSDGLGHGVKANILSTLTASMIINLTSDTKDIKRIAEFILMSLPVCSVRKLRYSTFSIISIDLPHRKAVIIEYDNPMSIVYRDREELECNWESIEFDTNIYNHASIRYTSFDIEEGDRILVMSDGVTQSGLGSKKYPFGWKRERVVEHVESLLASDSRYTSANVSDSVVEQAFKIDDYYAKDDISCLCATISYSKNTLLCSCPPLPSKKASFIDYIDNFNGKKVICGYHLARLISIHKGANIMVSDYSEDPELQPMWYMNGVNFVTESLVTLNKLCFLLQNQHDLPDIGGAAFKMYKLLLESESITILMGLSQGSGGDYNSTEYELRRKVMICIANILESKFDKKVTMIYK